MAAFADGNADEVLAETQLDAEVSSEDSALTANHTPIASGEPKVSGVGEEPAVVEPDPVKADAEAATKAKANLPEAEDKEGESGDSEEPAETVVAKIGDNEYETLQAAIEAAEDGVGDTIELTENITATKAIGSGHQDYANTIYTEKIKELTIDLNGHTIDCKNNCCWLYVDGPGNQTMNLTVKNGTIQNASGTDQGSAIWAWGALNLDKVTFSNCSATESGGAVFVETMNNTAAANVTGCRFVGNNALYGGALYIEGAEKVDVSDTTFDSNTVSIYGGAISYHNAKDVTMRNSTFTNNDATNGGGAVFASEDVDIKINNCVFNRNGNKVQQFGGAIFAYNDVDLKVEGCSFNSNEVATCGGAICSMDIVPELGLSKLNIIESTFTGNKSLYGYGGALYASNVTLSAITESTFTDNKAPYGDGGALYLNQTPTIISGGEITGNLAKNAGGGIAGFSAALTMDGENVTKICNNIAENMGDDIFSDSSEALTLFTPENATLKSNDETVNGKLINGWYIDGKKGDASTKRWGVEDFYEKYDNESTVVALKAARGLYTVTYTDGVDDQEVFADQVYDVKEDSATPVFEGGTPTRSGYTFAGWSPAVADTVTGNVTYTAQWRVNIYVTYYTVTYTDGVDGEVVFADQTDTVAMGESTPAFRGTPTREGYTFTGWSPAVAETVTGNVRYVAQWSENTNIDDPDTPLGPGPDDPSIDDPDVPLGPGPEGPTIDDPDVPLAPAPAENADPNQPKTGDEAPFALLMGMFLVSAGALGMIAIRRKEKTEK